VTIVSEPLRTQDDARELLSTAETAECNCPEFCERDHDTD
jgi:hypothetical protein